MIRLPGDPLPRDFAACTDERCPSKHECWRFLSEGERISRERQVYGGFSCKGKARCEAFVPRGGSGGTP
mgnify:CR=1 FL=1